MTHYQYKKFTTSLMLRDMRFGGSALKLGDELPQFDLPVIDGDRFTSRGNNGRPFLLITGSITCPMTASGMPALKRLHAEFSDDVDFVTLYVREAHPGENFGQPSTLEEKSAHAAAMKREYEVPWTVAVDTMDGGLHKTLDSKPNDAYLVDADGKIVFRSLWSSDESALRAALVSVVNGDKPLRSQSIAFIGPVLKSMAYVIKTMRLAGPQASRDLLRSAPPMYLMAWVVSLFR